MGRHGRAGGTTKQKLRPASLLKMTGASGEISKCCRQLVS